jgi:ABC-2 type transport system permease protein
VIERRRRQGRPDWLVIARREFIERVRSPWFVIGTVLGPLIMVASIVVPAVLARTVDVASRVQIVDHSHDHRVGPPLVARLRARQWQVELVPGDTPEATLLRRIADDHIDGFLTIPAAAPASGAVVYQGDNATNDQAMRVLAEVVTQTAVELRATDAGLPFDKLAAVLAQVDFQPRHTTGEAGGGSGLAATIVGYVVMFVLYLAIVLYAVNVLRSVVQEKTNRVVEIMIAAAKPHALMLGKIGGVGAVGLLQISIWTAMAVLTMTFRGAILGVFGVESAADWNVPPLAAVDIAVVLTYFVLGYFFYASIYAAVGAMVSSEQEAQQVQAPIAMLLVIPVVCVQLVSGNPRGTAAEVLTQIPFSSPVLMPMRWLLGGASTTSLLVSMAILIASTLLLARIAARIYRTGILMYGKRPGLRELIRWLRY